MPYYDDSDKAARYERSYDRFWQGVEMTEDATREAGLPHDDPIEPLRVFDEDGDLHDAAWLDEQVHQAEMTRDDE